MCLENPEDSQNEVMTMTFLNLPYSVKIYTIFYSTKCMQLFYILYDDDTKAMWFDEPCFGD